MIYIKRMIEYEILIVVSILRSRNNSSRHITDTPASEREFLENLHDLDHKINFINLQVCLQKLSLSNKIDVLIWRNLHVP